MNTLLRILQKANPEKINLADVQAVRQLVKEQKDLVTQASANGELPIQIAKQKGITRFEVAIARNTVYKVYYSPQELHQLLINYISELSEEYWCSGWYSNIEYDLWKLLHQRFEQREQF